MTVTLQGQYAQCGVRRHTHNTSSNPQLSNITSFKQPIRISSIFPHRCSLAPVARVYPRPHSFRPPPLAATYCLPTSPCTPMCSTTSPTSPTRRRCSLASAAWCCHSLKEATPPPNARAQASGARTVSALSLVCKTGTCLMPLSEAGSAALSIAALSHEVKLRSKKKLWRDGAGGASSPSSAGGGAWGAGASSLMVAVIAAKLGGADLKQTGSKHESQ
eukprot:scaffold206909_cov27-Tisochrysis_lutea.AAC.1